jgi:hypothetical protein
VWRFRAGSRASYHSHAFDSISWLLRGKLIEQDLPEPVWSGDLDGPTVQIITEHLPGFRPIITRRSTFYRVFSIGTSWVLTFRGPWSRTWFEARPTRNKLNLIELAHGRKVVMP